MPQVIRLKLHLPAVLMQKAILQLLKSTSNQFLIFQLVLQLSAARKTYASLESAQQLPPIPAAHLMVSTSHTDLAWIILSPFLILSKAPAEWLRGTGDLLMLSAGLPPAALHGACCIMPCITPLNMPLNMPFIMLSSHCQGSNQADCSSFEDVPAATLEALWLPSACHSDADILVADPW